MHKESIQVPTDEASVASDLSTPEKSTRRLLPVIMASGLSVIWIGACVFIFTKEQISYTSFTDLAPFIAAATTPIAIFWLIALAFQRTDPLLERRLAVANNLHKATAPVEEAEKRLSELNKSLETELKNIDAVSELAAERIQNLENRFQTQISDLFSATADTEAKTTSIRDILSRERDSLSSLSSDLETRFMTLEKTVNSIADKLEGAGHSISANANTAKSQLEESIANYGDSAGEIEERVRRIRDGLQGQSDELQASTNDVEKRLTQIHGQLTRTMSDFSGDIGNIEARSNDLSHHMQTQAAILKELAETSARESEKIEQTLKSHMTEVREAANDALERTNSISEIVSDRSQSMSDKIISTVEDARAMLDEAGTALEKHGAFALQTGKDLNIQVSQATALAGEEFAEKAKELDQLLSQNFTKAQQILDETSGAIEEQSKTTVAEAEAVAERTLNHIRQLRAGIEDQMRELAEAGESSKIELTEQADELSKKTSEIVAQASQVSNEFGDVQVQLSAQGEAITDALNDTRIKLSRLEDDLLSQQEALHNASEASANKVVEAAERFANRAQEIQSVGEQSGDILQKKIVELGQAIQSVGEDGQTANQELNEAMEILSTHVSLVREEIANASGSFESAAGALANERERLHEESEASITRINRASDNMHQNLAGLADGSSAIADQLEAAGQTLIDRTSQVQDHLKSASQSTQDELSATLDEISNKAGERVAFIREEMQAALSRVLEEYQGKAEIAEKESSFLAARLGKEASQIAEVVENFLDKSKEIEDRIAQSTKNEFARTSSLLMESLQSSSIDLNKALSKDIPDSVWASYTDGDKSIFMRRSLMFGDRRSRKIIAEKYKSDSEFRTVVARYFRDFEGMMERAMIGDKGSVMSVTLLSSDMGKLYVLLAQALKKFT